MGRTGCAQSYLCSDVFISEVPHQCIDPAEFEVSPGGSETGSMTAWGACSLTFDSTTPGVCFMPEGLRLFYGIELLQAAVLVQRLLPHAC
jgi:hypothetical protein